MSGQFSDEGSEAPSLATAQPRPTLDATLYSIATEIQNTLPGETEMATSMLADFHSASLALRPFNDRDKVVIFGSARITEDTSLYRSVVRLARHFADAGFVVITGGGPGAMSAGLEGAGPGNALGIAVNLPFESPASFPDIPVVHQRRFFTRKLAMVRRTRGVVVVPGGFGTMDETFEVLTLLQTGKKSPAPVVLFDPDGSGFFDPFLSMVERAAADNYISPADTSLFAVYTDERSVLEHVRRFWSNFDGFTGADGVGRLTLRNVPSALDLDRLAETFAVFSPLSFDEKTMTLSIRFERRNFGLLRRLIDACNDLC